jgi:hypothetical protein
MSQLEVDKVIPQSGTTLTLGESGDTITIASGATFTPTLIAPIIDEINDNNGNEEIIFTTTTSAVNELTIANAATGNAPEIAATGDDTDIDLKLTPKGAGNLVLDGIEFPNADGSASQVLQTNGSGVLSFVTPSAGSLVKLQSQTITGSVASVTFTSTYLTSTYPIYKLMWYSVHGDTNDQAFSIKFSTDNGSSYLTSVITQVGYSARNAALNSMVQSQSINQLDIISGTEDDAEGSAGGELTLFEPSNSTQYTCGTVFSSNKVTNSVPDEVRYISKSFFIKDTSAINNFQIFPNTGNLNGGTFVLYGVAG